MDWVVTLSVSVFGAINSLEELGGSTEEIILLRSSMGEDENRYRKRSAITY